MNLSSNSKVKSAVITAIVTRADGRIEDHGIVAEWHQSFWQRWRIALQMAFFVAVMVLAFVFKNPGGILAAGPFFMDAGKAIGTNLISGIGGTVPKYCAMGTGAGPANSTATALSTEVETRGTGTPTRGTTTTTNDKYICTGTVTATTTRVITECGLFDASSVGNMFIGSGISTINLASGDSITFTYNLTLS